MPDPQRFRYLFDCYAERICSQAEKEELYGLIRSGNYSGLLEELVAQRWEMPVPEWIREQDEGKADANFQAVLDQVKVKRLSTFKWVAAAASVIVVLGLSGYLLFFNKTGGPGAPATVARVTDIQAPHSVKAAITLADGRVLPLDSLTHLTQSDVTLTKTTDGKIIYSGRTNALAYNTLTNPKGSKVIDMVLSDGSHVWLNAGSSISYPVAFVGSERKVSITGEAYFEVAHNAQKPFYVTKGAMEVKVLGTHFNVNAYEDEEAIRVTLLEGSVQVSSRELGVRSQNPPKGNLSQRVRIQPGEQAALSQKSNQSPQITVQTPDLDQVMAWKNGLFKFDGTNVQAVMRQISKWYDVEVSYPRGIPKDQYWGGIKRDLSLSNVFKILEASGGHFKIEGRKVTVLP